MCSVHGADGVRAGFFDVPGCEVVDWDAEGVALKNTVRGDKLFRHELTVGIE